jgi:hypothetical protein
MVILEASFYGKPFTFSYGWMSQSMMRGLKYHGALAVTWRFARENNGNWKTIPRSDDQSISYDRPFLDVCVNTFEWGLALLNTAIPFVLLRSITKTSTTHS